MSYRYITDWSKFKTQLCHHYEKNGTCSRGSLCVFAHGQSELLPIGYLTNQPFVYNTDGIHNGICLVSEPRNFAQRLTHNALSIPREIISAITCSRCHNQTHNLAAHSIVCEKESWVDMILSPFLV